MAADRFVSKALYLLRARAWCACQYDNVSMNCKWRTMCYFGFPATMSA